MVDKSLPGAGTMFPRRLLVGATSAALSTPAVSARRLPVRVFTVADGLSQNETPHGEDSRGFN